MTESEILEKMKTLSIKQRIHIIAEIWQTIDQDMNAIAPISQIPERISLRGKVTHYDDPYEPVAATDWEAFA